MNRDLRLHLQKRYPELEKKYDPEKAYTLAVVEWLKKQEPFKKYYYRDPGGKLRFVPDSDAENKMIKHHGITTDPGKASFIARDGKMIGGTSAEDVSLEKHVTVVQNALGDKYVGFPGVHKYLQETGSAQVDFSNPKLTFFTVAHEPTAAQIETIRGVTNNNPIFYSLSREGDASAPGMTGMSAQAYNFQQFTDAIHQVYHGAEWNPHEQVFNPSEEPVRLSQGVDKYYYHDAGGNLRYVPDDNAQGASRGKGNVINIGGKSISLTEKENTFITDNDIRVQEKTNMDSTGEYLSGEKVINLNISKINNEEGQVNKTFYHELGHAIDEESSDRNLSKQSDFKYEMLTDSQSIILNRLSLQSPSVARYISKLDDGQKANLVAGNTVTVLEQPFKLPASFVKYSSSPSELFAEGYSQYRIAPDILKVSAIGTYYYMSRVLK